MTELWKPVVGFEFSYDVSSLGNVRSIDRLVNGHKRLGKLLSPGTSTRGYKQVALCGKVLPVHVLVLSAFACERPYKHQACHNDGDKANNSLANLRWATAKDNMRDRLLHGRTAMGEYHHFSKLNDATIRSIRNDARTSTAIAADLGISISTVCRIKLKSAWAHVT
jgi:hypothetical protein